MVLELPLMYFPLYMDIDVSMPICPWYPSVRVCWISVLSVTPMPAQNFTFPNILALA